MKVFNPILNSKNRKKPLWTIVSSILFLSVGTIGCGSSDDDDPAVAGIGGSLISQFGSDVQTACPRAAAQYRGNYDLNYVNGNLTCMVKIPVPLNANVNSIRGQAYKLTKDNPSHPRSYNTGIKVSAGDALKLDGVVYWGDGRRECDPFNSRATPHNSARSNGFVVSDGSKTYSIRTGGAPIFIKNSGTLRAGINFNNAQCMMTNGARLTLYTCADQSGSVECPGHWIGNSFSTSTGFFPRFGF